MSNTFQVLVGADAFIDALHEALKTCHKSLYVQFSTFEGDESGKRVADMMIGAAEAGVDVRLIVDCYSDMIVNDTYPISLHRHADLQAERAATYALYDQMREHGIAIQRSAPIGFMGMYMFYRDHKKMVVIDEQTAFVGGICVSDHNFSWHDFFVKIEGNLATDIGCDFTSTWEGKTQPFDTAAPSGDFIMNQSAGRSSILQHIVHLIDTAQESIVIESPYMIGDMLESKLLQAAKRGVAVTIIMPLINNQFMFRVWSRPVRQFLNHPNVHIYGMRGKNNMTHAKLIVVDNKWAGFGSYNLSEIEALAQKDLTVFSDNPDLLRQFQRMLEDDLKNSVLLEAPRQAWGRGCYRLVYCFLKRWTESLLKNKQWVAIYG